MEKARKKTFDVLSLVIIFNQISEDYNQLKKKGVTEKKPLKV